MLPLCKLASRFLARIEMSLCDLVHKGEHCHSAPPSPAPPRGSMQILDQVPQDLEEPIWGSAGSFKSQTTGRREFLSLTFHAATGWKSPKLFLKDNQTNSTWSCFFIQITGPLAAPPGGRNYFTSYDSYVGGQQLSDQPHNKCVKTFLTLRD